ncbi:MAG: very short patch repair endonuclease [Ignavibacteria bacterium RBG_13_36_8]|nr:MAG: very short patch repair endonuclease [Ignavibacteria bacterium RBG_13_36_8]
MADTFTKEKRSEIMRSIKSKKNVSTEIKLINLFRKYKIKGWRRNYKLYGKPDFVFLKSRLVIFTDGCFWHGHNCRNTKPVSNAKYWLKKISRNKERDLIVSKALKLDGWKIFRIWECEIGKYKTISKLKRNLTSSQK